jgi:UDP-N-acetylmuramyl pentapeptide synthase
MAQDGNIEIIAVGTDGYGRESTSVDDAARRVSECDESTAVLVKGSRVAGLERIVDAVVPN